MPRRGGRERYRTKPQVLRATDYRPPQSLTDMAVITVSVNGGPRVPVLQGGIALCRVHGVPWTICQLCSKAKAGRNA